MLPPLDDLPNLTLSLVNLVRILYLPMPFFRIDKVFRRLGVTAGSGKPQGSCSFLRSDIWGLRFAVS